MDRQLFTQGYRSVSSIKGMVTRGLLNKYMPAWRRKYFAMIIGPEHYFGQLSEPQSLSPPRDDREFIFGLLLRSGRSGLILIL